MSVQCSALPTLLAGRALVKERPLGPLNSESMFRYLPPLLLPPVVAVNVLPLFADPPLELFTLPSLPFSFPLPLPIPPLPRPSPVAEIATGRPNLFINPALPPPPPCF